MNDGPQQVTGYRLRDRDDLIARLRQTQADHGPSRTAIATQVRLSRQQVSLWLRGSTGTVVAMAFDLAHALGYDLALIPREQPAPEAAPCGCPVRYERARILSHTRECCTRESAERLAAYIAQEDT